MRGQNGTAQVLQQELATTPWLVRRLLANLGEDPGRSGLLDTPQRVTRALEFLTSGYRQSPAEVVSQALFPVSGSEVVVVRDIEFYSLCEHHMLPFHGRVHVGYLPDGQVLGLSKLPRLVEVFSRRLQVQERLTGQVADALMETLRPRGVAVVVEASHLCMMMRGVRSQGATTFTVARRGERHPDLDVLAGR